MRNILTRLLLLITLLSSGIAYCSDIHFIQLHNRQADELIPTLQPLLDSEDAISGNGYQLIVRTSDEQFEKIQSLVQQLDTAPQQLRISVRQGSSGSTSSQGYSASGSIGNSHVQMGIGGTTSSRSTTITTYGNNGSGSISVYHSQGQQAGNSSQQLMVLEGRWATIDTGQQVPVQQQTGTAYVNVTSGFDVRPRLNGSEVTLEIAPYQRHLSSQGIDTQSINTTVRGSLGEWIEIGGASESSTNSGSGIAQGSESQQSDNRSVWLKVELAN